MRLTTLVKREYKSLFVVLQSIKLSGIMGEHSQYPAIKVMMANKEL